MFETLEFTSAFQYKENLPVFRVGSNFISIGISSPVSASLSNGSCNWMNLFGPPPLKLRRMIREGL